MSFESSKASSRIDRLNQVLFEELSALVEDELRNPCFSQVRIRAVELSVDARSLRVHFVVLEREPESEFSYQHASRGEPERDTTDDGARSTRRRDIERAFERATPFLRHRLTELVELKRVPDLRFIFHGFVASLDAAAVANAESEEGKR